ncbi:MULTISPECIES: peptidoglycan-binding domain-containing protein [Pseudanabaena]|uniref:Peptidoglycan-binding domain 1 protein n=2 Tax=Pseudanabaena TaxID=1152 RepID=L8N843_9CYAN|nr:MULTISPECIES: peptidoglycan-binding protein [Pseudanabaena]ELS34408.1 Peptidoglycan-binding domain 1 protein [Pseudanabaena biceps PCC 7429]MDG3493369.1 peptidoglycan-binding domain-containing protein [Pseudanabaena catenata USMAC16]
MELAAYIYDAWAYEQTNQGASDRQLLISVEFTDGDRNGLDWSFAAIRWQAYVLSAIALTSLGGWGYNSAPASAFILEPSVNVAPWCTNLYLCDTSYMLEVQTLLAQRGFAVGDIDGVYGGATKQAVIDFQKTQPNLIADGIPGEKTLVMLRNSSPTNTVPQKQVTPTEKNSNTSQNQGSSQSPNQTITIVRSDTPQTPNSQTPNSQIPNSQTPNSQRSALSEIGNLQLLLKQRGFYQGEIDGQIGQSTTEAIMKAQRAYALTPDGFVGPLTTRSLLAGGNNVPLSQPALPRSPTPQEVVDAQLFLKERGFYGAELNGQYDLRTKDSILKAQLAYGQPATGELSPELLTALKSQNSSQNQNVAQSAPNSPQSNPNAQSSGNVPLKNTQQAPSSSQNAPVPAAKSSNST